MSRTAFVWLKHFHFYHRCLIFTDTFGLVVKILLFCQVSIPSVTMRGQHTTQLSERGGSGMKVLLVVLDLSCATTKAIGPAHRSTMQTLKVQQTLLQRDLLQHHLSLRHLLQHKRDAEDWPSAGFVSVRLKRTPLTFMLSGRPRDCLFSFSRLNRDSTVSSRVGGCSAAPRWPNLRVHLTLEVWNSHTPFVYIHYETDPCSGSEVSTKMHRPHTHGGHSSRRTGVPLGSGKTYHLSCLSGVDPGAFLEGLVLFYSILFVGHSPSVLLVYLFDVQMT